MVAYITLILAITLACVAGVQYFYLMFLETCNRQQQRRIAHLEQRNEELIRELQSIWAQSDEQSNRDEQVWPELIDEGNNSSVR